MALENQLKDFKDRELEVLDYMFNAYTTKAIAIRMGLGTRTVEYIRQAIKDKFGVTNVIDLVKVLCRQGYVSPMEQQKEQEHGNRRLS